MREAGCPSTTVLVSPVVVLVLGNAAARTSGHLWGVWSWIPVILVYWITLAGILGFAGGWTCFRRWLQPSQGAWGWCLLSFATTALFIPVFSLNFRSLNERWIIGAWLAIAIIDPWLEEGYWRGLLMDAAGGWPGWMVIAYTTVWFGLSHPLLLGVNVKALSGLPGFFGTIFTGTIWSTVYWKTREIVRDLADKGNKKIVLNLGEVQYIDSSGVGELVKTHTTIRNQGGELKLTNLNKRVHDLLQMTRLSAVFDIQKDETSAIQSFGGHPSSQAAA